ncbi:LysR family transcriptional regulator [Nocardiopsis alba]|jgi:DNA-binding transcriptional LysR family regulator|uniref:LysR family transcriptional regulator n=1 Tax=Nocardiopsis alba TaxID=53437 RepID=A0A7K2IPK5_9ACTN|nr:MULTISPECIES: LysR family transcriptional regulator [Nocardiopsis]MEC3893194.1 LysR family transcriptional regulator [Nocardiopsis sp. LDBS1602]MYR31912.1 LysR family transcriptional regulator [Nocardiopsis alba]
MEIRHLALLRELAERGSVTAVAEATHRTPSAVSQQLKAAQREFGTPLVEPSGRGLRLNEAGLLLAEGGVSVAAALERVQARWDSFRGEPSGTVTVAALPSAATFLLSDAMHDLADTSITLRCSDYDLAEVEFAGLTADNDVVIAHSLTSVRPAGAEGLTVRPLAREPLDIAMAADHPLADRTDVSPDDLVDLEWIGVPEGYPFDTVPKAIEQVTGKELRVTQRLWDNRLIESLVAGSALVAVLPRFTTPPDSGVVLRPLTGVPSARHVSAVLRPDKAERLAVQRVLRAFEKVGAEVERRHRRD